jgi:hypothetical protein
MGEEMAYNRFWRIRSDEQRGEIVKIMPTAPFIRYYTRHSGHEEEVDDGTGGTRCRAALSMLHLRMRSTTQSH